MLPQALKIDGIQPAQRTFSLSSGFERKIRNHFNTSTLLK